MFGREIRTLAELAFSQPPDAPRRQLFSAGMRQKRAYDLHTRERDFGVGELVWVYSPVRKREVPKARQPLGGTMPNTGKAGGGCVLCAVASSWV